MFFINILLFLCRSPCLFWFYLLFFFFLTFGPWNKGGSDCLIFMFKAVVKCLWQNTSVLCATCSEEVVLPSCGDEACFLILTTSSMSGGPTRDTATTQREEAQEEDLEEKQHAGLICLLKELRLLSFGFIFFILFRVLAFPSAPYSSSAFSVTCTELEAG